MRYRIGFSLQTKYSVSMHVNTHTYIIAQFQTLQHFTLEMNKSSSCGWLTITRKPIGWCLNHDNSRCISINDFYLLLIKGNRLKSVIREKRNIIQWLLHCATQLNAFDCVRIQCIWFDYSYVIRISISSASVWFGLVWFCWIVKMWNE